MEENQKVQKYNIKYMAGYVMIPALIMALCIGLNILFDWKGMLAVVTLMVIPVLCIVFWCTAYSILYKRKKKEMPDELHRAGFVQNHTFNGNSCTVVVDEVHAQVGLLFGWNPFQTQIFPASHLGRVWVDDGAGGSGFMRGSSRVSFLFEVDGIKVRVNTFTSNKRWRMDSDYILTGISKADMMAEILNKAKEKAA